MNEAIHDLRLALNQKSQHGKIDDLVKRVGEAQNAMMLAMQERQNAMAALLSPLNYARYLVFEHEFHKEMQKMLMQKKFKGKKPKKKPPCMQQIQPCHKNQFGRLLYLNVFFILFPGYVQKP
jgi:hypothetical protein